MDKVLKSKLVPRRFKIPLALTQALIKMVLKTLLGLPEAYHTLAHCTNSVLNNKLNCNSN